MVAAIALSWKKPSDGSQCVHSSQTMRMNTAQRTVSSV